MNASQRISNFVEGLPTFFIGVVVVFGMLALLIIMMILLGKAVGGLNDKMQKTAAEKEPQVAKNEVAVTVEDNKQDELELIAVITAAIAASLGTTSDKLQVRSLRKVQRKSL